ncbi:hypothetical protein N8940_01500 [Sphingomonadaceae bacterium]|nr:hypothetical protein [Sphingomonadaceae bacterium]
MAFQIGSTFLPALGFGEQIGDRSDAIRTLVVPSGWAFSIWGLLFLGSAIFAVWQAIPALRSNALLDKIAWFAAGATGANGAWATYTQFNNLDIVSAIIILFSLGCLLMILRSLVSWSQPFSTGERWIAVLTFSALAAWLTVASTVNISATLAYYGVAASGQYPLLAAIIILVAGVIGAAAVLRSRGNPWFALVIGWAMLAIYFKGGQEHSGIALAAAISGVLPLVAALIGLRNPANRRHWLGV